MKPIKEFTVKWLGNDKFPIIEINGEKINGITKLIVKYDPNDEKNNLMRNGFFVEYLNKEDGRYYKQTIGQSFSVGS